MKLCKIQVRNYRLLKQLDLDLEEDLSLVIGKNNTGKTSLLSVLNKFIGTQSSSNNFTYDDFNVEFKSLLFKAVENDGTTWNLEPIKGIELYLYISFDEVDSFANIRPLFFNLNPDNNMVILKFEYTIETEKLMSLIEAFKKYYERIKSSHKYTIPECFENFIKEKHRVYFSVFKKAIHYDKDSQAASNDTFKLFDTASPIDVSKIIAFKYISARRDSENKDNDGTLSGLSARYYEKTKPDEDNPIIQNLEDALVDADASLSDVYQGLFSSVIDKVKKFGGIRENETIVKLISTLSQQPLLKGNTTVIYEAENHQLPESYNGLGYLNLISIIIEIETLLSDFRNDRDASVIPADINLLLIEEPEAHTHPQMQYIFIKNIKELLREGSSGENDKKEICLQTIMTSHSSHIVAACDFDDIKYFHRVTASSVYAKNMKDLEIAYKDEKSPQNNHFKFLKQYLNLNYAEVFFADKAILYEGETERILLPAIMKKIDEEETDKVMLPLLSQNISLIESGAYSQIFDQFLSFVGIKTLIVTDIDAVIQVQTTDKNGKEMTTYNACMVDKGTHTSNGALKHYYKEPLAQHKDTDQLDFFTTRQSKEKILSKRNEKWVLDPKGSLMLVYQTKGTDGYYPRSFEDAFIQINKNFIIDNLEIFESIKKRQQIEDICAYEVVNNITSKASFAMDILLNSEEKSFVNEEEPVKHSFSNWEIPPYIKEGLLWLRSD